MQVAAHALQGAGDSLWALWRRVKMWFWPCALAVALSAASHTIGKADAAWAILQAGLFLISPLSPQAAVAMTLWRWARRLWRAA